MKENINTNPNFNTEKYYSNIGSNFNNYYDMKFDSTSGAATATASFNRFTDGGSDKTSLAYDSANTSDINDDGDLNTINYINNINNNSVLSESNDIFSNESSFADTNSSFFASTVYGSPDKFSSSMKKESSYGTSTSDSSVYASGSYEDKKSSDSYDSNYGTGNSFGSGHNYGTSGTFESGVSQYNTSVTESSNFDGKSHAPEHIHISLDDEPFDLTKKSNILSRPVSENVIAQSYILMTFALIITAISASITLNSDNLMYALATNRNFFTGLLILELAVVIIASHSISKDRPIAATILFVLYSGLNGVTFSIIFLAYHLGSVLTIFLLSAALFAVTGVFGIITKSDLSKLGNILIMGLFGIIILGIANIFLRFSMLELGINIVGIFIFLGLSAYDSQKIKKMAELCNNENTTTLALYGALELYLDFINLFLRLLRIFGKRK